MIRVETGPNTQISLLHCVKLGVPLRIFAAREKDKFRKVPCFFYVWFSVQLVTILIFNQPLTGMWEEFKRNWNGGIQPSNWWLSLQDWWFGSLKSDHINSRPFRPEPFLFCRRCRWPSGKRLISKGLERYRPQIGFEHRRPLLVSDDLWTGRHSFCAARDSQSLMSPHVDLRSTPEEWFSGESKRTDFILSGFDPLKFDHDCMWIILLLHSIHRVNLCVSEKPGFVADR